MMTPLTQRSPSKDKFFNKKQYNSNTDKKRSKGMTRSGNINRDSTI